MKIFCTKLSNEMKGIIGKESIHKKQLNGEQLTVEDVQKIFENDTYIADKIVRFGEGSC
jgi:hypothetical protein